METLLEKSRLDTFISNLSDEALNGEFDKVFINAPLPKESHCGIGFLRGKFLQKFANKKCFIFVFGVVGLIFSSTHAYYNGTISTMEKRFKIPSKNMGFIATGNDITGFMLSTFIAYYGGRGHRPRWMAVGIITIVIYCLMNVTPHFLYGPGSDSLSLTVEFGGVRDDQQTKALQESNDRKIICQMNATDATPCQKDEEEGNIIAQIYFFGAQLIAGVGQSLKHTLGITYLDDNIKKSKTPALISFSYFIRLLGPAAGYALASFSLKMYIAPNLTPTINNKDPRWVGAWFFGWIFLAAILLTFSILMALFPKELPRAALRRRIAAEKERRKKANNFELSEPENVETSIKDFFLTSKRLLNNKLFMLNNLAGVFYVFGFMPFWIFSPKLIETLFRQSSSASNLFTGTFGLVASALGLLFAGFVISKFKPRARYLAFWNVIVGLLSVLCVLSFSLLGCEESRNAVSISNVNAVPSCNFACNCDFVKYSPVCGANGVTYISACHAGCKSSSIKNSTKMFDDCSCVEAVIHHEFWQTATKGPCLINCQTKLTIYLVVMCFMKFIGSTGRASNFLVGIRCVEDRDKTLAIGFGMSFIRLLAAVPSPIFFGYILDQACIAWGKTCSSKGNCWLYDSESLRYWFFYCSAFSIAIGTFFDFQVWRNAKDLKIFDENVEKK